MRGVIGLVGFVGFVPERRGMIEVGAKQYAAAAGDRGQPNEPEHGAPRERVHERLPSP